MNHRHIKITYGPGAHTGPTISVGHRLVTDKQMTHDYGIYGTSMASRGENFPTNFFNHPTNGGTWINQGEQILFLTASRHVPKRIVVLSDTQCNLVSVCRLLRVRVLRILRTLVRTVELYKTQHTRR